MNFADRLFEAVREKGSVVVVGLDPRPELLPPSLSPAPDAGAEAVAKAFLAFNEAVIEAVAPYAVAVKPQVAFYEKLGPAGMETFARTCRAAAERGLLVIGDVKRGDIGSTAEAYADAWFGGPYACDAITLNPYLGADSLRPFVSRCEEGYGCFVLVRTSNPGAADLQDVRDARGRPLYLRTAEMLASLGGDSVGECGYSAVGAVVGATWPEQLAELRAAFPSLPFLVPGYGAQGGTAEDVRGAFDADGLGAVVNSSRGIIFAYRKYESYGFEEAAARAAREMRDEFRGILPALR